jgi:hypothetical protein
VLRALAFLGLTLAAAPPAFAQDSVDPRRFLDAAVGKTLTFRSYRSGRLVGEEQFLRRDLSVWTDISGRCTYGNIVIEENQICFLYEDDPDPENCWQVFRHDGSFLVMSRNLDVQQITRMTEDPIFCDGAPVS